MGKILKKKKLYRNKDFDRKIEEACLVFIIVFADIYLLLKKGINNFTLTIIGITLLFIVFYKVVAILVEYLFKRKKQKIKENGRLYIGKYIAIDKITKLERRRLFRFREVHYYEIIIELNDNGLVIKDGLYSEDPGYYIHKNDVCRVYEYKNKYYPEDIYYTTKNNYIFDIYEREEEHKMLSDNFRYRGDEIDKYLDVKITCVIDQYMYRYSLPLNNKINEYVSEIEYRYEKCDEERMIKEFKTRITTLLYTKIKNISNIKVDVIVKDYDLRKLYQNNDKSFNHILNRFDR